MALSPLAKRYFLIHNSMCSKICLGDFNRPRLLLLIKDVWPRIDFVAFSISSFAFYPTYSIVRM